MIFIEHAGIHEQSLLISQETSDDAGKTTMHEMEVQNEPNLFNSYDQKSNFEQFPDCYINLKNAEKSTQEEEKQIVHLLLNGCIDGRLGERLARRGHGGVEQLPNVYIDVNEGGKPTRVGNEENNETQVQAS